MTIPTFITNTIVHTGALNTLPLGINTLSLATVGASPPRSYVPQVKLRRVASQTVSSATRTLISWDTVDRNTDSMFTLSNPTQVTVQTAGSYGLDVELAWGSSPGVGDFMVLWALLNGTVTSVNAVSADEQVDTDFTRLHISTVLPNLTTGNTVYVMVYQNTGGSVNIDTGTPVSSIGMWRLGP